MAASLPVVANPVAVQREMVEHGATGYLVATPQEWADAIQRLAESPVQRIAMGAAARELVERRYSVAAWEQTWIELLDRLTRQQA
jgi:glycosyltransferase involved in cell wall biosynthesis